MPYTPLGVEEEGGRGGGAKGAYVQWRREGYQRLGAGQCISAPSLSTSIVKSQNKAAARGSGGAL